MTDIPDREMPRTPADPTATNNLSFRDATPDDLPAIVSIYNSTVASRMVTADLEPVSIASRQDWFDAHSPQKRPLWIACDEHGKTVGWASFQSFYGRPAYDSTAELSLYLSEKYRGKGYGQKMLQYCVENAGQCGIKTILAFIFSHNEPSIRLFRKFGFEDWGVLPGIALLDDQEKGLHILGKKLTPTV